MKIYVASSWRNNYQQEVVHALRTAGHEVYDFKNPEAGNTGFEWSEINVDWQEWEPLLFRKALYHPLAKKGFNLDFTAMEKAEGCVLVLPSGRSAHLEGGYFVGANKPLFIFMPEKCEPELMYKMALSISFNISDLIDKIFYFQMSGGQL